MLLLLLVLINFLQLCIELYREYKTLKREIRGQVAMERNRRVYARMNEDFNDRRDE